MHTRLVVALAHLQGFKRRTQSAPAHIVKRSKAEAIHPIEITGTTGTSRVPGYPDVKVVLHRLQCMTVSESALHA
jgi:hypothetical protein